MPGDEIPVEDLRAARFTGVSVFQHPDDFIPPVVIDANNLDPVLVDFVNDIGFNHGLESENSRAQPPGSQGK